MLTTVLIEDKIFIDLSDNDKNCWPLLDAKHVSAI